MDSLPEAAEFSLLDSTPPEQSKTRWTPKHTLEEAVSRVDPTLRRVLENTLKGAFREVVSYRPSPSLMETSPSPKAGEADLPLDAESEADEENEG